LHGQEVQGKQEAEVKGHEDDPTSSKAIATSSRDGQAGAQDVCHKDLKNVCHAPCEAAVTVQQKGKSVSPIFDASPSIRRKARKQVQCRNLLQVSLQRGLTPKAEQPQKVLYLLSIFEMVRCCTTTQSSRRQLKRRRDA
jgi:hypothetical protein